MANYFSLKNAHSHKLNFNLLRFVFSAAVALVETVAIRPFVSARRKSDEKRYQNRQLKKMVRQNAKVSLYYLIAFVVTVFQSEY